MTLKKVILKKHELGLSVSQSFVYEEGKVEPVDIETIVINKGVRIKNHLESMRNNLERSREILKTFPEVRKSIEIAVGGFK